MIAHLTLVSGNDVIRRALDWNTAVEVYDAKLGRNRMVGVSDLSVFDHRPIVDGVPYRILRMLSKGD